MTRNPFLLMRFFRYKKVSLYEKRLRGKKKTIFFLSQPHSERCSPAACRVGKIGMKASSTLLKNSFKLTNFWGSHLYPITTFFFVLCVRTGRLKLSLSKVISTFF